MMNADKLKELLAAATPGPWGFHGEDCWVGDKTSKTRHFCANVEPFGDYRGSICGIQSCDHIGGITMAEAKANAALIVAAVNAMPSLIARLEAAEKVVEAARVAEQTLPHTGGYPVSTSEILKRIRTAITTYDQEKARG